MQQQERLRFGMQHVDGHAVRHAHGQKDTGTVAQESVRLTEHVNRRLEPRLTITGRGRGPLIGVKTYADDPPTVHLCGESYRLEAQLCRQLYVRVTQMSLRTGRRETEVPTRRHPRHTAYDARKTALPVLVAVQRERFFGGLLVDRSDTGLARRCHAASSVPTRSMSAPRAASLSSIRS
jgi:hypothetical protein